MAQAAHKVSGAEVGPSTGRVFLIRATIMRGSLEVKQGYGIVLRLKDRFSYHSRNQIRRLAPECRSIVTS